MAEDIEVLSSSGRVAASGSSNAMRTFPAKELINISQNIGDQRARRDGSWYGYSDGDSWGAIPFSVSHLYRGQNGHYAPMLPSIARGLQSESTGEIWRYAVADQAKVVLRLAQSWWFSRELEYHPVAAHAASQRLGFDQIALAQHYGIPTGYLDLTDDFNVSAFFATCRETKRGWEPVEDGEGVIYRVGLAKLDSPFGRYQPLGPQPLPRPTEQSAWVTELPLCHSFEGWPDVGILGFVHERRVGEHFLDMFAGGDRLFPPDPLAGVAAEILSCREIPAALLEGALESFAADPHGVRAEHLPEIRGELAKLATSVDYRRLLSDEQVASLLGDFEWRKKMLPDVAVKWRAVRTVPVTRLRDGGVDG